MLGYVCENNCYWLVFDLAKAGTLYANIKEAKLGPISFETKAKWIVQLTNAVKYLHQRPEQIIHRDIKPKNILVLHDLRFQ